MTRRLCEMLLLVLCTFSAAAQVQSISIAAGTPEDVAIQEIGKQADDAKRIPMWEEFVTKFASNPAAVAYGNSQIAQIYLASSDAAKAMAAGEKALAAMPANLDVMMTLTTAAQQAKDSAKIVRYATMGGKAINGIEKTPKPEGYGDADWAANLKEERRRAQQQYQFLDAATYSAIAEEGDAKKRVGLAEQYDATFPDGQYLDQVHQFAISSLLQAKDFATLAKYGEKALAASPDNVSTLALLGYALVEDGDPKNPYIAKAMEYARKAVELGTPNATEANRPVRLSVGLAHEALGYALMKQEKTAASIPEFKSASALLKDDPGSHEVTLFRMGYAYAKLKRAAEARQTLNEVIAMKGPFEEPAKKVLAQMAGGKKE